jgi:long-chain acyl-CoA synthetase
MTDPVDIWRSRYGHPSAWDEDYAPLSLPDMFAASVAATPDAPLIDFMGRKYSYRETADGVRRVARGLLDLGVKRGDRIGLYLPNVPHYVAAYYGALSIGATIVNFSPLYSVEELAQQVLDGAGTALDDAV